MRLIDADKLYEILKNDMVRIPFVEEDRDMFYHNSGYNCAMTGAYLEVEKQPTIEAAPVVHGKWIIQPIDDLTDIFVKYRCSVCGYIDCGFVRNFCANSGADMRKGAE